MRMMLRWTVPVERGNEAIETGALSEALQRLTERLRPEATYYFLEAGERAGCMVFEMTDPAEIARIAEPLFNAADAAVDILPVMTPEDMQKGLENT